MPLSQGWQGSLGSVSFDTFFSPLKPLTLGLGYRYARRELENEQDGRRQSPVFQRTI
jgi:hypothetical protein